MEKDPWVGVFWVRIRPLPLQSIYSSRSQPKVYNRHCSWSQVLSVYCSQMRGTWQMKERLWSEALLMVALSLLQAIQVHPEQCSDWQWRSSFKKQTGIPFWWRYSNNVIALIYSIFQTVRSDQKLAQLNLCFLSCPPSTEKTDNKYGQH